MKQRKIAKLTFFLLILLLSFPVMVNAEWQNRGYQGDWEYRYDDSWKSPYSGTYSVFHYNNSQNNLQKWTFGTELTEYDVGGYWEFSKCVQTVYVNLTDSYGTHKLEVYVSHETRIHLFGFKDVVTHVKGRYDGNLVLSYDALRYMFVEVYFWKNATDTIVLTVITKYHRDDNNAIWHDEKKFTVGSSWFSTLKLWQTVEKALVYGGSGLIKGLKYDEELTSGDPIGAPYNFVEFGLAQRIGLEIWNVLNTIYDLGMAGLPEGVRNLLSSVFSAIYQFFQFVYNMAVLLGGFIMNNLPLLLSVYGLYLLYIIFSCIESGDYSRLFEHFIMMANFFIQLWKAIFGVIQTIINLIKWW